MKGIIYKWTCNVNGKSYIGQTTNEKQREKEFLSENKPYAGEKINNARKKYGLSNGIWTKTVLKRLWCKDGKENELRERLNYWEKYYVELYDSINNGYNITNGGDCDFSQEVIEEMRRKSLEKWNQLSEADKTRHRERSKNWWNNLSDEEKKEHIEKSKEKYDKWCKSLTEEERIKYTKSSLGLHRGHSSSRSQKSSEYKKGTSISEKTKKKIKEKLIGCSPSMYKYVYKYSKNKSELIETYNSISEAAKSMDMKPETLVKHNKTIYKGFYWEISETQKNTNNPEGCYFIPRINRWRSTIYYKGEKRLLGHFETPQAASAIREMAKQKKEEGIFDEWYENIHSHKIEIFKKFGEKTCN